MHTLVVVDAGAGPAKFLYLPFGTTPPNLKKNNGGLEKQHIFRCSQKILLDRIITISKRENKKKVIIPAGSIGRIPSKIHALEPAFEFLFQASFHLTRPGQVEHIRMPFPVVLV